MIRDNEENDILNALTPPSSLDQFGPMEEAGPEINDVAQEVLDAQAMEQAAAAEPAPASPQLALLDEFRKLQEDRRNQLRRVGMLEAGAQLGQAFAGSISGNTKVDPNLFKTQKELADLGPQEFIERQKVEKTQTGLTDDEMLRDPGSRISEAYRKYAKERLNLNFGDEVSAFDISNLLKNIGRPSQKGNQIVRTYNPETGQVELQKFDQESGSLTPLGAVAGYAMRPVEDKITGLYDTYNPALGRTTGTLASRVGVKAEEKPLEYEDLNPKQRKTFEKIEKEFRDDIKDQREFADILSSIEDLVNSNIGAAIPAIKRQLARSIGREVGVMTDRDVEAFSGDPSFIAALERFAALKISGKMTERDREQYRAILEIAKRNLAKGMQERSNYHIKRIQKMGIRGTPESLQEMLSVGAAIPQNAQPMETVKSKKTGKTYQMPTDKAKKARELGLIE